MHNHQAVLSLQMKPFFVLLHETLDQLIKKDTHGFFAEPVSLEEVFLFFRAVKGGVVCHLRASDKSARVLAEYLMEGAEGRLYSRLPCCNGFDQALYVYAAYCGQLGGLWESVMDSSDFNHIMLLVTRRI